jgi:hypothetical protein
MGGNFAIASEVLRALNGFDPRLGFDESRASHAIAGEDTALAEGVRAAGLRLVYEPRATVRHLVPAVKLRPTYYLHRMYWGGRSMAYLRRIRPAPRVVAGARRSAPMRNLALSTRGFAPSVRRALGSLAVVAGMWTERFAGAATRRGPRDPA